jgi:hypothetical protein
VMMQPSAGGFYPYYPLAAGWRYPSVDQGIYTCYRFWLRAH